MFNTAVQEKTSQRARVEKREWTRADDEASKRGILHLFRTKADANGDYSDYGQILPESLEVVL